MLKEVVIHCDQQQITYTDAILPLIDQLDAHLGAIYASSFEYPGRYTCWDIGFINPPLMITAIAQHVSLQALNARGEILLKILADVLPKSNFVDDLNIQQSIIRLTIQPSQQRFAEEQRSKQNSVFSLLRVIIDYFKTPQDDYLGLYGAFGYDLVFQFEQLEKKLTRDAQQRDLVLYLPDEIYVVDHRREQAFIRSYDFSYAGYHTAGLPREGKTCAYRALETPTQTCDHPSGAYIQVVQQAQQKFKQGDLFEVVPGQTFFEACQEPPSTIFKRMRHYNPSPYGFFINLGEEEYLVGASPEMYLRTQGKRVETCPISGTIRRGDNAIEDAYNIQQLLDSEKESSELTMCTDVDRNDKSRICVPGSVKVIGRRQIEMYSRLIHTVDHVEGMLREGYDAVDAFLSHMWVVTVTGAPKLWAMQFIEEHERSPRKWYAGAVGWLGFNGDINTGLVLRTVRMKRGIAEIRVGATLLYDSIPEAEEQETRLKASAFIDILRNTPKISQPVMAIPQTGKGKHILLVDHQDSFVHTLANYLRQTGAQVTTWRNGFSVAELNKLNPDLIALSPGPGTPSDFNLAATIEMAIHQQLPIFGVCLGLQGLVEYFGGELGVLEYPMHGKPSKIKVLGGKLFKNLPSTFIAGRYHSLFGKRDNMPKQLIVTAQTEDNVVMAIEHQVLPIYAVQFHPESILSLQHDIGLKIIGNLLELT